MQYPFLLTDRAVALGDHRYWGRLRDFDFYCPAVTATAIASHDRCLFSGLGHYDGVATQFVVPMV